ncbi:MAG: hypothetical protein KGH49_00700 [Candidatus Micrarchaeota archaeon]|nr:hypothetical protein [Candidatus Micrarchaeota archaeon]
MRSADLTTLFRTALIFVIAYMIVVRFDALTTVFVIAVMFALDAVDGKLAKWDKKRLGSASKYGPRLDVASDRIIEYVFWIVYSFLGVIPVFVLFLIVIRHSFVDALMGAKGTSSVMKTRIARILYSSDLFRGGVNVVKWITFSYLALVYISGWPLWIGYALTAILVIYIMVRGIAEAWEAFA